MFELRGQKLYGVTNGRTGTGKARQGKEESLVVVSIREIP